MFIFYIPPENKILTIFRYCWPASDNAGAQCNMTLSCAYFMAEIAMSIKKVYALNVLEECLLICINLVNLIEIWFVWSRGCQVQMQYAVINHCIDDVNYFSRDSFIITWDTTHYSLTYSIIIVVMQVWVVLEHVSHMWLKSIKWT